VSAVLVGYKQPTIKPDDLVRTRDGRTALCVEIMPAGFRRLEDAGTGRLFLAHVDDIYLVRSAKPKPWAERKL
jgi:hypothetical protein